MQIKFVEIHNILSIGKIRLEFDNSGLVLLDGWNHDDSSANGAGKSAIPNSIAYGLYDKIPRKISKSEILRRGTKKGYVHVGVQVGNDLIEVKRCRPKNIEYYINGSCEDITQEEFENKIKMSYSQFLVCMYAAQTEGKRFLSLNDTEMKDFILKLMDLDKFLMKKKEIDSGIKDLNDSKLEVEKIITGCESKKSVYVEQLVSPEEIQKQIDDLSVAHLEAEYSKTSQVPRPDYDKFEMVKGKINEKLRALDVIDANSQSDRQVFKYLQNEVNQMEKINPTDGHIQCPSCDYGFMLSKDGHVSIDAANKKHQERLEEKRQKLYELRDKINSGADTRAKREELTQLMQNLNAKIRGEEQIYQTATQRLADMKTKITVQKQQIQVLQDKLDKNDIFKSKISEIDAILAKASTKLSKISNDINLSATISTILAPTGAPAYIVDAIVDIFNEKVSDYVSLIWPNATYQLQAFKENKSGDIRAKFSDKLIIAGRNVSIGSLSGGEFRCLSLSVDFAIIDVVESIFGFSVSPVFLDEPFEGLDLSNRERVVDLLEKLSTDRQIWIIDHASEAKSMFSDVVRIEKKNGMSDII